MKQVKRLLNSEIAEKLMELIPEIGKKPKWENLVFDSSSPIYFSYFDTNFDQTQLMIFVNNSKLDNLITPGFYNLAKRLYLFLDEETS